MDYPQFGNEQLKLKKRLVQYKYEIIHVYRIKADEVCPTNGLVHNNEDKYTQNY